MDSQSEKSPGLHLPQPSVGEGPSFAGQYEEMSQRPEIMAASRENYSQPPQAPPVLNVPAPPIPVGPSQATDGQIHAAAPVDDDDADDLDKEWINKAKTIVEQTRNDPYTQSREIGKVKADYLRIRYNKHIKAGQDKAL